MPSSRRTSKVEAKRPAIGQLAPCRDEHAPAPEVIPNTWGSFEDLDVDLKSFQEAGIVRVRPYTPISPIANSVYGRQTSDSSFKFSTRDLSVTTEVPEKNIALLNILKTYIGAQTCEWSKHGSIANSARREEVFSPFKINSTDAPVVGHYIYPWLSKPAKNLQFTGFTQIVTAGCMFGSVLKGSDKLGCEFNLIKHDIEFHPGQKIDRILFNHRTPNPYEEVVLEEFKKLILLVNPLYKQDAPKKLHYHLPYYDYMLFGVELFVRGRMTLEALSQLFKIIILKRDELIAKISAICAPYNIECIIESPFKNLFGEIHAGASSNEITTTVFTALGLSTDITTDELDDAAKTQKEQDLVRICLHQLRRNAVDLAHRAVWNDLININGEENINNLEDLFKIANATMVLHACKGTRDYETCSLLPLSEKQISVNSAKYCKLLDDQYPATFNLTTMDPVMGYNHTSNTGLLFYFNSCRHSLSKLVSAPERGGLGILDHAHANIASLVDSTPGYSLDQILQRFRRVTL